MTEKTPPDRMSDKIEGRDSPTRADQDTNITTNTRHEGCNPYNSPSSPRSQSQVEPQEDLLGSSTSDGFRSDDPDQGQFYPMSAQQFEALGQENQYADLPLVFSLPNNEDDSSKVYGCHICKFKTAFKNSLVNHQAVHSDARPWICEICDYAAKRKQDLKKHLQTMHGMIVDSLSLRLGSNPQTCVSSSSLSSPVDTKPVIVGSAVSSDQGSSAVTGYAGSHFMNSVAHFAQQQTVAGLRQPVHSSALPSPTLRPTHALGVGKLTEDQFPFSQIQGPNSSTETEFSPFKFNVRKESDSKHTSGSDNFFIQKNCGHKNEQRINSCSQNVDTKSCAQVESKDQRNLSSVSDSSKNADEYHVSANSLVPGSPKYLDSIVKERSTKPEAITSYVAASSHSGGTEMTHRQRKVSSNSVSDQIPIKLPRFQSPGSDIECCPQVTSQSDRMGNSEFISSTVARSCGLETKKSFHCVHCDILFFESAMYLMHAGLHDSTNPWKCSICGRTFFEKYSFTSHFINQH